MNGLIINLKTILRKFFGLYIIDENKPVSFFQQLLVTGTILAVTCVVFTVVYFCSFNGAADVTTTELSNESKASPVKKETSKQEVSTAETSEKEVPSKPAAEEKSKEASQESEQESEQESSEESIDYSEMTGEMTTVLKTTDDLHRGNLILINKELSCRYDGDNIKEMVGIKSDSYMIIDNNVSLDPDATMHFNDMMDEFASNYYENELMVACGYRDYNTQAHLYFEEIRKEGEEVAEKSVAPPGYSEHQSGYSLDLNLNKEEGLGGIDYDGDGIYSWINSHCDDYGFVVRYAKGKEDVTGFIYEPWHFRYVGLPHSTYMTNNDLVLEEYLDKLKEYSSDSPLFIKDVNGRDWLVYYVGESGDYETEIPVPENKNYQISGDNYSGFIVTVEL